MISRTCLALSTALVALTSAALPALAGPPAPPGAADRKCYAPAKKVRSLKVHENFIATSPVVDRIAKGRVFWGEAVVFEGHFENKVQVFLEGKKDSVGIARRSETVVVPTEQCKAPELYQGEGLPK